MTRDTKSSHLILAGLAMVGLLPGSLAQASEPSPLKRHVMNWAAEARVPGGFHGMRKPASIGAFRRQVKQIEKTGYRITHPNHNQEWVQAMTVAPGAGRKSFTRRTIGSEPWFSIAAAGHLLSATTTTKDGKQQFKRKMLFGDGEVTEYTHTFKVGSRLAGRLRAIAVDQLAREGIRGKHLSRQDLVQKVAERIRPGSDVTYTYEKRGGRFHPVQASVGGLNWIKLPGR